MQTRTLGKTGLEVSILGFGASPLGGVFGAIDQSDATWMVHEALDHGVNFIDVSPFYGVTRAETCLGNALAGIRRDRFILATKVGRYDAAEFDFSSARTRRSVDESLSRLKVDCIDLIQCHDIEFGSLDQVIHETIPTLIQLREVGKVKFVGITGLPLKIFSYVTARVDVDTVLSYCHYTLYDDSLLTILPGLVGADVGVISAAPLGMGLLTDRPLPEWHPAPRPLRVACAKARSACEERGMRISDVALQFALANPLIASTLVGIGSRAQLEANLAAVGHSPDEELMHTIGSIFADVRDMSWPSGLPENN